MAANGVADGGGAIFVYRPVINNNNSGYKIVSGTNELPLIGREPTELQSACYGPNVTAFTGSVSTKRYPHEQFISVIVGLGRVDSEKLSFTLHFAAHGDRPSWT